MIREWLLIIWLGTTTNFTLQGVYWNHEDCARAREEIIATVKPDFVVACVQDMREGRSGLPSRPGSSGIVK